MAIAATIEVYALNVAATPHPEGIYISSLRRASRLYAKVRGSDFAKITTPVRHPDYKGMYFGRILVWTEIKGKWLNLIEESELPENLLSQIVIPDGAKPNYRVFNYVFDESRHILYVEGKNEFGETLGPTMAKRLFARLLANYSDDGHVYDFAVTILPDETAVSQILDMRRLRKLVIRITRPNADTTSSPARRRLFQEMSDAELKQIEITRTKIAGASKIEATESIRQEAEIGAADGFVKGYGSDINGKRVELSTDAIPKKLTVGMDSGGSFIARLMATLGIRRH